MIKRIRFLHMVGLLGDTFRGTMRAELPGIDCFHTLTRRRQQQRR
jgi:hypothetical protein